MTRASASSSEPGRRRGWGAAAATLLIAVAVAVMVFLGTDHWTLRPDLLPYALTWMLNPVSGFVPMVLALWLALEVPRRLVRRLLTSDAADLGTAAPGIDEEPDADEAPDASAGAAMIAQEPGDAADEEELVPIPVGSFRELGVSHRAEIARALGIPWRDELIHDHQSWAVACLEAAQRRAAELRR